MPRDYETIFVTADHVHDTQHVAWNNYKDNNELKRRYEFVGTTADLLLQMAPITSQSWKGSGSFVGPYGVMLRNSQALVPTPPSMQVPKSVPRCHF